MKNVILYVALLAFSLTSCNSNASKQNAEVNHHEHEGEHDHASMNHSADSESQNGNTSTQQSSITSAILDAYLSIKDALVKDDQVAAGKAGELLTTSIGAFNYSSFKESDQQELKKIFEIAKENGEHISKSEIDHQREHFVALGKNIKDIVSIAGTDRTLYQQYCPMYNNGSMWLSVSNEIRNPFFGSKMLKCGSVQEEISVN